uniref:Uncharacterized protein n=1 Tax=Setaria italica TaxID=4555 RepID=K3ZY81_SETIT
MANGPFQKEKRHVLGSKEDTMQPWEVGTDRKRVPTILASHCPLVSLAAWVCERGVLMDFIRSNSTLLSCACNALSASERNSGFHWTQACTINSAVLRNGARNNYLLKGHGNRL